LKTVDEAIAAARAARGGELDVMLKDLASAHDTDVQIVNGDFNEPSFRDWTARAVEAGQQPLTVEFPTTKKLESLGFGDAMRVVYPDEVARPAFTWTPTKAPDDPAEHQDRIDYIFVRGKAEVTGAGIVGEKRPEADIVVTPWPSDHRAVYATIRLTD
jgi:endonuclease/exonuclease/phosphatase family metal-dependent hydrolase